VTSAGGKITRTDWRKAKDDENGIILFTKPPVSAGSCPHSDPTMINSGIRYITDVVIAHPTCNPTNHSFQNQIGLTMVS